MRDASYIQDASLDAPEIGWRTCGRINAPSFGSGFNAMGGRTHKRASRNVAREVAQDAIPTQCFSCLSHREKERERGRETRSFMLRMARFTGDFVRNRRSSAIVSLWIRNKWADAIVRFVVLKRQLGTRSKNICISLRWISINIIQIMRKLLYSDNVIIFCDFIFIIRILQIT